MSAVKVDEADLQVVSDQIRHLTDEALQCRTLRHAWSRNGGFYKVDVEGGVRGALYVERTLRCLRDCGVTRVELCRVHPNHIEKLWAKYAYPKEGYKLHGRKKGMDIGGMLLLEEYMREMADINGLRGGDSA